MSTPAPTGDHACTAWQVTANQIISYKRSELFLRGTVAIVHPWAQALAFLHFKSTHILWARPVRFHVPLTVVSRCFDGTASVSVLNRSNNSRADGEAVERFQNPWHWVGLDQCASIERTTDQLGIPVSTGTRPGTRRSRESAKRRSR